MAYTKSIEYFKGLKVPDNMIIRFSLWDDTAPEQKSLAEKMRLPIYTAVERFTDEKPVNRCLCENCSTCQKCWTNIDKLIKKGVYVMTLKDFFGTIPETIPAYIMDYRTGLELYSASEKTPGRLPGSIRNKRVIDYIYLTGKHGEYIEIYINNGKSRYELEF